VESKRVVIGIGNIDEIVSWAREVTAKAEELNILMNSRPKPRISVATATKY